MDAWCKDHAVSLSASVFPPRKFCQIRTTKNIWNGQITALKVFYNISCCQFNTWGRLRQLLWTFNVCSRSCIAGFDILHRLLKLYHEKYKIFLFTYLLFTTKLVVNMFWNRIINMTTQQNVGQKVCILQLVLRWRPIVSVFTHYFIRSLSNVVPSFKTIVW